MKVLAIIPARGQSKGLPRKNILPINNRPLIYWTINAAQRSQIIDRVILSSEDEEIIGVAKTLGCDVPFTRPQCLATDEAQSIDVVLHAIDELSGYDFVVLLQPTSPLRTGVDIDEAFRHMKSLHASSCVSVCEASESPYWMYVINKDGHMKSVLSSQSITQRQKLPPTYILNGAIYIANVDWLKKNKNFLADGCVPYVMPKNRSLDIDTIQDFQAFKDMVENMSTNHIYGINKAPGK